MSGCPALGRRTAGAVLVTPAGEVMNTRPHGLSGFRARELWKSGGAEGHGTTACPVAQSEGDAR